MPLRVAPCPKCGNALVFGERSCRSCGQVFNYGERNPPEPTFAQLVESLRAAGHPPPRLDEEVPSPAARATARPSAPPAPAPHPRSIPSGAPVDDVPAMAGLDTGRFAKVGDVSTDDIPGFIDSSLFKAFTPAHVNVQRVADLDTGRALDVGEVRVQRVQDVEHTAKEAVGAVRTQEVPGVFHSDFLRAPDVPIIPQRIDGLERSPSGPQRHAAPVAAAKRKLRRGEELERALCPCGETHRLSRCPSCGTPHPDARD